jgi:hypothetical protein
MKLKVLGALVLVAISQVAYTQPTAKDRDTAVKYLEETKQNFLKSIDGLSEAQWTFKAGPDRWSIAETAEHIAISESTILSLIRDKVMQAPKPPTAPATLPDQTVIAAITDRTQKAQAPEMLKPTNRWATRDALTKEFVGARQKTVDYVKTTTDDLRGHFTPHPALQKDLDAYQWVLLLAAHSARHTAQIEEVKASPGYPKK